MYPVKLKIKDLEISPPVALAPMVGLSHSALRCLLLELGGVGMFFTEMLSAKRLPSENETISPLLIRTKEESPLFYQIFLTEKCDVGPAVEKLHLLNAQGIDVNLGCPAPQLRKLGAGSALSERPEAVKKILNKIKRITELPISVKLRLGSGEENKSKFIDFCSLIADEGIDCLVIHARLNGEKFCRKPRWDWIPEVKKNIAIPIIANGGIQCHEDARRCLEISCADGLMVGRAAAERPWIFSEISRQVYNMPLINDGREISQVYMRFAELLQMRFPQERRLGRLKQFTHYFASSFKFGHYLASSIQTSSTLDQALERAGDFFSRSETIHT